MRFNSEGIERENLLWSLGQAKLVRQARKIDSCLLCRRPHVNEAALCAVCWGMLDEAELRQATRWTTGVGP